MKTRKNKSSMPASEIEFQISITANDWDKIYGDDERLMQFLRKHHPHSKFIDSDLLDPRHLSKPVIHAHG